MSYMEKNNGTRFSNKPISSDTTQFSERSQNSAYESLSEYETKDIVSETGFITDVVPHQDSRQQIVATLMEGFCHIGGETNKFIPGLQASHPHPAIRLPPGITHSEYIHDRHRGLRDGKILPH